MRGGREAAPILTLMQQSVARMSALIDNILDFARGRLGGGIALNRAPQSLQPVLVEHDGLKLNRFAAVQSIDGLMSRTRRITEPGPKLRKQPHAK